jgi:hypothetical protein
MNWLDSMVAEEMSPSIPYEAARVPGDVRWLAKVNLNSAYRTILTQAAVRKGARRGFLYNILGKGGKLLDVGSAATLTHLFSRLAAKKRRFPQATRASVSYVKGLPGSRDPRVRKQGGIDRKILHCHELLRQYRARSALRKGGNYDPSMRVFDEDD